MTWCCFLADSQSIGDYKWNNTTSTLVAIFLKPAGEANDYVRFYMSHIPFAITPEDNYRYQWYLIQSMQIHSSTINNVIIGQWSWKIFYINKKIKWCEQLWTSNRHPFHYLSRYWGSSKPIWTVWISPMDNFLSHLRTIISINVCWSNQYEQTSQQSPVVWSKNKRQSKYFKLNWRMLVWMHLRIYHIGVHKLY